MITTYNIRPQSRQYHDDYALYQQAHPLSMQSEQRTTQVLK
ncbi:hypothetical protein [Romeriopsis navalis]|nr:hypothetical protein [Romeriopsis navalis]